MLFRPFHISAFAALLVMSAGVHEAGAQSLPGSADPSRFNERFERGVPEGEKQIEAPASLDVSTAIPEAPDGFVLQGVQLEGLSVFDEADFSSLINEYVGRSVDLNVLNHLAVRITARYREAGYFLAKALVPQQEIESGVVKLQVIEGYVHDVRLDDPEELLERDLLGVTQDTLSKIKTLNPLHGPTLERYILILNEQAGLVVQTFMESAPDAPLPGGVTVVLKITKKKPLTQLSYNNHGSRFVGPHQLEASYVTGNVLSAYDTLSFQASTAIPMSEVQYGSLSYKLPLNQEGLSFETLFSYSNSVPGFTLKPLEVESDSFAWEGGLSYPLIRSRRTSLDIQGRLNVLNTATEFLDEELIDDKVRSLVFSADYSTQSNDGAVNTASLSLHKGLNILGATRTGNAKASRAQGRSDFTKIGVSASRQQPLPRAFGLFLRFEGQYAPHPLLSSQEFGYGGAELGRAYDPSEITGDSGAAASAELRYTGLPPLKDSLFLTPFAFYDIGKVWNKDTGSVPLSAASAGFGLHYQTRQNINGALSVAWPLTKTVTTPIMGGSDGPRILFDLSIRF